MPIYEYHCKGCRKNFERLQKMSDRPLATCPECGKKVKKLISQTSFALKGGGWYKDGYASGKASGKGESAAKAESGGKEANPKGEKADVKRET